MLRSGIASQYRGQIGPTTEAWSLSKSEIYSFVPEFRWTSCCDNIGVQTQEPTPISSTSNPDERGRFAFQHRAATVVRLFLGESQALLGRELGVTGATHSG
jgi:hypothetical protein